MVTIISVPFRYVSRHDLTMFFASLVSFLYFRPTEIAPAKALPYCSFTAFVSMPFYIALQTILSYCSISFQAFSANASFYTSLSATYFLRCSLDASLLVRSELSCALSKHSGHIVFPVTANEPHCTHKPRSFRKPYLSLLYFFMYFAWLFLSAYIQSPKRECRHRPVLGIPLGRVLLVQNLYSDL